MKNLFIIIGCMILCGCGSNRPANSDRIQQQQQETVNAQATNSVGMPNIINFRERRLLKQIYEMRDQELTTYTYLQRLDGTLILLCESIGYGIPYSTQFTNPERIDRVSVTGGWDSVTLPQADPNSLFSPSSTDSTWVMCLDPISGNVSPVQSEPTMVVSTFRFTGSIVGE